ncbi:hypothetical protein HGRIS_013179 [Hohenbuehelia grisea]|uniref:Glycoside hydrolase family 5 domain-containing protein n=1 Tax=Hohenbuehelia grisea TaxID=104357 RepID=A0ABR3IUS3_9AGAR
MVASGSFLAILQTLRLAAVDYKPPPNSNAPDSSVQPITQLSRLMANSTPVSSITQNSAAFPDSQIPAQSERQDINNCHVEPYTPAALPSVTFPAFDQTEADMYRYRKQQAVNLGSWFVQENWMTPSLFVCAAGKRISELDVASGWGSTDSARALLERHWDTFITQSDFDYLARIGINTVRLPLGYWSLGPDFCKDTPFAPVADVYLNSWDRVRSAINMAARAGIGVLVDLHGAVGSQNGQSHSGISDGSTNLFKVPANMDRTIDALKFLVQQFSDVNNVVGIQVLNEPQNVQTLYDFYTRAINEMRNTTTIALPLYMHNGFDLQRCTDYNAGRADFVVQDHHSYFVFTSSDAAESASNHTADINTSVERSLADASTRQLDRVIIGEWSCALTPQSLSQESDPVKARRDFCTGQLDVYNNVSSGWAFWCKSSAILNLSISHLKIWLTAYKKEQCDDDPGWCFRSAVGNALPNSFFSYGGATGKDPAALRTLLGVPPPVTPSSALLQNTALQTPVSHPGRRASKRKGGIPDIFPYRLAAIHRRRFDDLKRNTDIPTLTPAGNLCANGYLDGFTTAIEFATHSFSKLAFVGQFLHDRRAQCQGNGYGTNFRRGLKDAEAAIASFL